MNHSARPHFVSHCLIKCVVKSPQSLVLYCLSISAASSITEAFRAQPFDVHTKSTNRSWASSILDAVITLAHDDDICLPIYPASQLSKIKLGGICCFPRASRMSFHEMRLSLIRVFSSLLVSNGRIYPSDFSAHFMSAHHTLCHAK